ncbi:MAG: hypothetical protein COW02_11025 [Comamonadaceae bacterium CG12_big_fil_rev_8_21_14_0_65_59_15]|nr:MAG: hypothetical protein COW02_11025 [Comamonadaceae bacterium CG12_big_fil_rev_8_21_14_0_65_59_15]
MIKQKRAADPVCGIGILALVGVVVLQQELAVTVLDDRLRVGLYLSHHAQDFGNLDVQRRLGAVEGVTVEVGGFVAVVHQLGVDADLGVVAGDESLEMEMLAFETFFTYPAGGNQRRSEILNT